jgi:hypothetical protein
MTDLRAAGQAFAFLLAFAIIALALMMVAPERIVAAWLP